MIGRCVASLYAVDYPANRYEVIVVDNGSTDETARAAARAGARVVGEAEPNRCRARNLGARVARGRWLAFTDSDCVVDRGWLAALARAEAEGAEGAGPTVMAGEIVSGEPTNAVEAYIAERRWIDNERFLAREPGRRLPPFAATANLAIRRDVFELVGGFDPEMSTAGEDADWCWRARAAGHETVYVPGARVTHHHRATLRGMLRQAEEYGLGNAELFARAPRDPAAWAAIWGGVAPVEPPGEEWGELERYGWALKAAVKAPFAMVFARGRDRDGGDRRWREWRRWFAYYDCLSNLAQARGRRRGGRKHGLRVY